MLKMSWFIFLLILGGIHYSEQKDSLNLTVYYETYCPDSIDFITSQLAPLMGEFNQYPDWLKLNLMPFGKAKETSHHQFVCQHGPNECTANKIHACLIDQLVTRQPKPLYLRLVNFILCTLTYRDQIKATRKCAVQTMVNYKALKACYMGDQGSQLLEMYGNRTAALQPPLSWVPTIVINEVFNQTVSEEAQKNLYRLVCKYMPDQCE